MREGGRAGHALCVAAEGPAGVSGSAAFPLGSCRDLGSGVFPVFEEFEQVVAAGNEVPFVGCLLESAQEHVLALTGVDLSEGRFYDGLACA